MRELVDRIDALRSTRRPVVVAISGAVASGKSTLAASLANEIPPTVDVVATDGFLLPNAVLDERGLAWHKGFPETFDVDALTSFLDAARSGSDDLSVPVYSHEIYDVVPDDRRPVGAVDVLIVEGVNVLQPPFADRFDLRVYIDVAEDLLFTWFMARIHELVDAARKGAPGFYASWAPLSDDEVRAIATSGWEQINAVNLREHIAPSKANADVVITKGPGHAVVDIATT